MKLTGRDLKMITGTAVITSLIFITYNILTTISPTLSLAKSERISWNQADILKKEYEGFNPLKLRYEDPPGSGNFKTENLQGFKFNAMDLDEIINANKIVDPMGNPVKPDEIIFYLGKKGHFGVYPFRHANMHIIAAGMKAGRLLIPASAADQADARKSSVFDKADPCPGPGCP